MGNNSNLSGYNFINLVKLSFAGVLAQLAMVVVTILIAFLLGPKPESVLESYRILTENPFAGLLRIDLYNIVMICLYLLTVPGIIFLLVKKNPAISIFSALIVLAAVILAAVSYSGFSLYHLSKEYMLASDEQAKAALLAAGEAIVANDLWNSSAGYFGGLFLQGAGILLSVAMIRSGIFGIVTIISGIAANALDLFQHLIHPFLPQVSAGFQMVMGPFYLVWFIVLAVDLYRKIKIMKAGSKIQQ